MPASHAVAMPVAARDPRELFYDALAPDFDRVMNGYDLRRRIEVVFDELLAGVPLAGRRLLDAGCGTGWFSAAACERGAVVTSVDLGPRLLALTRRRCAARVVCADVQRLNFPDAAFDVVVSSECIEHTPSPGRAVMELLRVCRPGGRVVITCPNRNWRFAIVVANALGLRPYDGLENWPSRAELRRYVELAGGRVLRHVGLHLMPFVLGPFNALLRPLDRLGDRLGLFFVNQALLAEKVA